MPSFLIVDDSATLRKMIMAALRPLHPTFGEAGSGLEAIEQLALQSYDLVMLDLNMPDMHGLEFLRFLRAHSRLKDIPVLIVTTQTDPEVRHEVMQAGANQYITKPFTPGDLQTAIRQLLDQDSHDE